MDTECRAKHRRNPYGQLLLALCCAWLALGSYGWSPFELRLFGMAFAKWKLPGAAPSAHTLTSSSSSQLKGSVRRDGSTRATARSLPRAEVDARPQRILLFGDSMVPVIAPRLADYCLENGHELFPAVWYGSSIIRWAWRDDLDKLLVEVDPSMVVAVLGSTELTVRDVGECEPYVRVIARKVGHRKFVWIGPPNWREDTGVNALLGAALGDEVFFHSGTLAVDRGSDGIHPSGRGGAAWVDAFVRWLGTESAFPIRLVPPTRVAPRPAARVVTTPL
jgi:hypothetical protein